MKIQKLQNEQSRKIQIDIKKINKELCMFKAKLIVVDDKGTHEDVSEGIAALKYVRQKQKECKLPTSSNRHILRSQELFDLVKKYGFPAFSEKFNFLNTDFNAHDKFLEIMEASKINFDSFDESTIDEIIFVDYSSHTFKDFKTNKPINTALRFERLGLSPRNYKNYKEIVEKIIDSEKSFPFIKYGKIVFDYSGGLIGSFIFSNEEFELFLDHMMKDMKSDDYSEFHFDYYYAQKAFEALDFLGIEEHRRTQEEKDEYEEDNGF